MISCCSQRTSCASSPNDTGNASPRSRTARSTCSATTTGVGFPARRAGAVVEVRAVPHVGQARRAAGGAAAPHPAGVSPHRGAPRGAGHGGRGGARVAGAQGRRRGGGSLADGGAAGGG